MLLINKFLKGNIPEDVTVLCPTAKDYCRIMDMSINMIGQAFNSLSYYIIDEECPDGIKG